ncbi:hypothetical protein G6F56_007466 [Rhizopus delemar]|nr:hypothetical protein G6F56_007466 [Rhizopus delemar]
MDFNEHRAYSSSPSEKDDEFGSFSSPKNTKEETKDTDDDWGEFTWGGVAEEASQPQTLEDDFADFQSAVPNIKTTQGDLFNLLGDTSVPVEPQISTTAPDVLIKQEPVKETNMGMWAQASNFVSLDSLGKPAHATPTTVTSMNSMKNNTVQSDWNNWATSNVKPSSNAQKSSPFDDLLSL